MTAGNVVVALDPASGPVQLLDAVNDYFADGDLAATTIRVYERTLEALVEDFGGDAVIAEITRADDRFLKGRYGQLAAATFNRNRATIGSFFGWCEEVAVIVRSPARRLKRRKERVSVESGRHVRPIPLAELQALWQDHRRHSLRDRTFWVMAYETGARANELLGLDLEHLDLVGHNGLVIGKGGSAETIVWASTTALLLPRLIKNRTSGPLFLTQRRPRSHVLPARSDLCPTTGRARLSYRQAAKIFPDASGRTLHQLRHAALTHFAEKGVTTLELRAKSRHSSTRSLERYVIPSTKHVKALTDEHDPSRRTRPDEVDGVDVETDRNVSVPVGGIGLGFYDDAAVSARVARFVRSLVGRLAEPA